MGSLSAADIRDILTTGSVTQRSQNPQNIVCRAIICTADTTAAHTLPSVAPSLVKLSTSRVTLGRRFVTTGKHQRVWVKPNYRVDPRNTYYVKTNFRQSKTSERSSILTH